MRRATLLAVFLFLPSLAAAGNRISFERDIRVGENESVDTAASIFGSVIVDGEVTGTAVSVFGDVNIGPAGRVKGDAVSVSGSVFQVEGSSVAGAARSVGVPAQGAGKWLLVGIPAAIATAAALGVILIVASGIGFVVLVGVILFFFERQVAFASAVIEKEFLRSLGYGFLAFFALVPLVIFLGITIIGIPLAAAVAAVAFAAICLGAVAACEWTGRKVGARFGKNLDTIWASVTGLGVLFAIGLIPVAGTIVHIVALFSGLGAVIQTRFRAEEVPR